MARLALAALGIAGEPDWRIDLRERRPIPREHPGYVAGVSRLDTAVYGLSRI